MRSACCDSHISHMTSNPNVASSSQPTLFDALAGTWSTIVNEITGSGEPTAETQVELEMYRHALTEALRKRYKTVQEAFRAMDANGDGVISKQELQVACHKMQLPITAVALLDLIDVNDDEQISLDELAAALCNSPQTWHTAYGKDGSGAATSHEEHRHHRHHKHRSKPRGPEPPPEPEAERAYPAATSRASAAGPQIINRMQSAADPSAADEQAAAEEEEANRESAAGDLGTITTWTAATRLSQQGAHAI